jgi:hypothetical protein
MSMFVIHMCLDDYCRINHNPNPVYESHDVITCLLPTRTRPHFCFTTILACTLSPIESKAAATCPNPPIAPSRESRVLRLFWISQFCLPLSGVQNGITKQNFEHHHRIGLDFRSRRIPLNEYGAGQSPWPRQPRAMLRRCRRIWNPPQFSTNRRS